MSHALLLKAKTPYQLLPNPALLIFSHHKSSLTHLNPKSVLLVYWSTYWFLCFLSHQSSWLCSIDEYGKKLMPSLVYIMKNSLEHQWYIHRRISRVLLAPTLSIYGFSPLFLSKGQGHVLFYENNKLSQGIYYDTTQCRSVSRRGFCFTQFMPSLHLA